MQEIYEWSLGFHPRRGAGSQSFASEINPSHGPLDGPPTGSSAEGDAIKRVHGKRTRPFALRDPY